MSLIDNMTECEIINKNKVSDGEGGYITSWVPGASIKAAIVADSSMQARIAENQGVKSVYTITTHRNVVLDFGNVIRRKSDGRIFRVTSDSSDKVSPNVSTLDMRQVTAEKWSLTT